MGTDCTDQGSCWNTHANIKNFRPLVLSKTSHVMNFQDNIWTVVLRETWLSDCHRPFCVVKFAIGTKSVDIGQIKDIRNNDILPLAELKDAYSSLTKKVALSMKWIANNLNSKFVLKADEDTFVNLVELVKELNKYDTDLYMGYFTGRARVKKSGPWAEPNWLLCDYYLPNARGGGYVLGKSNVQFIAENADRFKRVEWYVLINLRIQIDDLE